MNTCPHCQRSEQQVKIGTNASGSQRYLCKVYQRKYAPLPAEIGYSEAVRQEECSYMSVDGMNFRRIERTLKVLRQSVANWVKAYVQSHAQQNSDLLRRGRQRCVTPLLNPSCPQITLLFSLHASVVALRQAVRFRLESSPDSQTRFS